MALKRCRECGHEVSTRADKCPNCGAPLKAKNIGCCSGVIIIFIVLWIILAIANSMEPTSYKPRQNSNIPPLQKTRTLPPVAPKKQFKEIRVCNISELNIRKGPGSEYKLDESGVLFEGEKLYVLEEKEDWIRFRVTEKDVGWEGWVSKKYTVAIDEWNLNIVESNISKWQKKGLLVRINLNFNEAFVNPFLWAAMDVQDKENLAKSLAYYCELKGSHGNYVKIVDSKTGKKLAKFDVWGFKVY